MSASTPAQVPGQTAATVSNATFGKHRILSASQVAQRLGLLLRTWGDLIPSLPRRGKQGWRHYRCGEVVQFLAPSGPQKGKSKSQPRPSSSSGLRRCEECPEL
jgi:hypothetical protein